MLIICVVGGLSFCIGYAAGYWRAVKRLTEAMDHNIDQLYAATNKLSITNQESARLLGEIRATKADLGPQGFQGQRKY